MHGESKEVAEVAAEQPDQHFRRYKRSAERRLLRWATMTSLVTARALSGSAAMVMLGIVVVEGGKRWE